ncbi:MAG: hypothetical protein EHM54_07805 [Nitrospiraceae bacterium]|nr:MAG: hypothetical protein EHM54_07805 [Nitrospiraceae bacterium]
MKDLNAFIRQVKLNCTISDAQFWGYYSICGLLMRYRELYRSEHSLKPWESIPNDEVVPWIQEREMLWKDLEDTKLQRIIIEGKSYDPFDVDSINAALEETGLVYSGGYGTFNKPTFFIAKLNAIKDLLDYRVHYTGSELCRDLAASPAMLQGRCIYVRPEVLTVFIWDRFQEMKAKRFSGATEEMFSHYGIGRTDESSPELFKKISNIASDAIEVFVLHEAGEAYEDDYSHDWYEILSGGCDKATELYLRGIKDILADTSLIGPLKSIVGNRNRPRLSFFLAFLDGIRRQVFHEIRDAFQRFVESGDWSFIEAARIAGYRKTERLQTDIIALWRMRKDIADVSAYVRDTFQKPRAEKR